MRKDTKLPPYLPYPRFLLEADMAQAAKLVYMVLLDRATLSQANGWTDEDGKLYLIFPIEGIANAIDRSPMTVKTALAELETSGLIERRRRGFSVPNHIYVKIPDGQDIVQLTDRKLSVIGKETCPSDGQKPVPMMERKLSTNHLSNNNLSMNHLKGASAPARARGRYQNVFLSDTEVDELQAELPDLWHQYVEKLSEYMASTGKAYQNYAATIRRWAAEDRRKGKNIPDYTYKEGESL